MSKEIIGSGFQFPLGVNAQGGFALTDERAEVEQAIGLVLMTSPGERVMRPSFGCRLQELLFQPNDGQTAAMAERYVEDALGMWEPRIIVQTVTAVPDEDSDGRLNIHIEYELKATNDRRSLVHPFYVIPEE